MKPWCKNAVVFSNRGDFWIFHQHAAAVLFSVIVMSDDLSDKLKGDMERLTNSLKNSTSNSEPLIIPKGRTLTSSHIGSLLTNSTIDRNDLELQKKIKQWPIIGYLVDEVEVMRQRNPPLTGRARDIAFEVITIYDAHHEEIASFNNLLDFMKQEGDYSATPESKLGHLRRKVSNYKKRDVHNFVLAVKMAVR